MRVGRRDLRDSPLLPEVPAPSLAKPTMLRSWTECTRSFVRWGPVGVAAWSLLESTGPRNTPHPPRLTSRDSATRVRIWPAPQLERRKGGIAWGQVRISTGLPMHRGWGCRSK